MASAPVLPTIVSTFATEPVLSNAPSVSVSLPEPRLMIVEAVRAAPSVIESASRAADDGLDVPDRRGVGEVAEHHHVVAVAEIDRGLGDLVREGDRIGARAAHHRLDVGHRESVGEVAEGQLVQPAPPSTEPFEIWAESVSVSTPVPPMIVSTLEIEATLAKLPSVRVSLPAPRSMEALEAIALRVIVSARSRRSSSRHRRRWPCWRSRRGSACRRQCRG